jgi:hypothetical protein
LIELGIDPLETVAYEETSALLDGFVSELRRLIKKTEFVKISREDPAQVELERAYFHDLLELLFNRAVEEFGKLKDCLNPAGFKSQLKNDLAQTLKRLAAATFIESDLCSTVLMDDFSELMARFVAEMERIARRPQIAA